MALKKLGLNIDVLPFVGARSCLGLMSGSFSDSPREGLRPSRRKTLTDVGSSSCEEVHSLSLRFTKQKKKKKKKPLTISRLSSRY